MSNEKSRKYLQFIGICNQFQEIQENYVSLRMPELNERVTSVRI